MKSLVVLKKEDFIGYFLRENRDCLDPHTSNVRSIESLRTAKVVCGRFYLVLSKDWVESRRTRISLQFRSNKTEDKVKKIAISSLPIKRFNKTLIAAGCNVRIVA